MSLTSYPVRFETLHLTLACLLDQTIRPDHLILWIAHQDRSQLPGRVTALAERGLEIRECDDLRSYKKLVPALDAYRDAFIVTADDDVYYRRDWLEVLTEGVEPTQLTVLCHRAHRIMRRADGTIAPYVQWHFNVQDNAARKPSTDLVPTGVGGILYPPRSLDPRVTDRSLFERLCPDGDDLWFYWCARMAGTHHRKVGPKMRVIGWDGTEQSSLWAANEQGGNDRMIAALQSWVKLD